MFQAFGGALAFARPGARLRWLRQLALSVLFVGVLAWHLDVAEALALLGRADPLWLTAALAIAALDRILMIARWLPLLAVQAPAIESAKAAKSYLAATFTNYFLPAIGPDLLRAASLGRPHRAVAEVGASIAAERMLGAAASVMMVLLALHIGLPAVVGIPELSSLTLVIPIALAGGFLLSFQPTFRTSLRHPAVRRFARLAHRFSDALLAYRHVPLTMLGVWLLTVAGVFFPIATLWILARSLGIDISPQALFVAVPISEFVAKVPISFAAIGTREATMISLLVTFGVQPDGALALAILSRAIDVLIAIPGVLALRELWHDLGTRPSIVGTAPRDAN